MKVGRLKPIKREFAESLIYLFIPELLPELMAKEPRLEISTGKVIVVDNIPKVGIDKKEKLKTILNKLLVNYGKITHESYPETESGVLKGYLLQTSKTKQFNKNFNSNIFLPSSSDTCLSSMTMKFQLRRQPLN